MAIVAIYWVEKYTVLKVRGDTLYTTYSKIDVADDSELDYKESKFNIAFGIMPHDYRKWHEEMPDSEEYLNITATLNTWELDDGKVEINKTTIPIRKCG